MPMCNLIPTCPPMVWQQVSAKWAVKIRNEAIAVEFIIAVAIHFEILRFTAAKDVPHHVYSS